MGTNCDDTDGIRVHTVNIAIFLMAILSNQSVLSGRTDLLVAFLYFVVIVLNMIGSVLPIHDNSIGSDLKIRIFGRDQDEAEDQPAGILKYVEDLIRGLNADIGRKDFFEMVSINKSFLMVEGEPY
jgi:hypothetical protein